MNIQIRAYQSKDAASAAQIWNEVVTDGNAFPQDTEMTANVANLFFQEQTYTGIAENADTHEILGLYILHPNNVGRCGHICNASYAVRKNIRGLHIGEKLVLDCLQKAKENQFRILQFNAVVATNTPALHLYERIGFKKLGTIPGGFRMPDGTYEDIIPHYYLLSTSPSITEEGRIQLIPDAPCIYDQLFTKYLYRAGGHSYKKSFLFPDNFL